MKVNLKQNIINRRMGMFLLFYSNHQDERVLKLWKTIEIKKKKVETSQQLNDVSTMFMVNFPILFFFGNQKLQKLNFDSCTQISSIIIQNIEEDQKQTQYVWNMYTVFCFFFTSKHTTCNQKQKDKKNSTLMQNEILLMGNLIFFLF